MPQPIIIPKRENPINTMASRALISLFLQKYQHKMDMEKMDKQAKLKQIEDAQAFGRDLYKEEYKKDIDLRNRLLEEGRPRVNDDESPPSPQSVTAGGMTFEPPKPQLYTLGGEKFALMGGKLHKVGGEGSGQAKYAPEMVEYVNRETGATMQVNVRDPKAIEQAVSQGFKSPNAEDEGYMYKSGQYSAEREKTINDASAKARSQVTTLQALDQLLDRFESGKLQNVEMTIKQYANSFGIPITQGLSDMEAFRAITEQLALQSRNMGEGMVLAGQMSDRDVQFLRDMNPQLVLSKSGNKKIIQLRQSIAKRQNEVAKLMREYKSKNKGRFDATGFDAYLENNFGKQSIFGIPNGSRLIGTDKKTGLPVYETPDGKAIIPSF